MSAEGRDVFSEGVQYLNTRSLLIFPNVFISKYSSKVLCEKQEINWEKKLGLNNYKKMINEKSDHG